MTLDLSKLEYVIFDWDNTLAESRSTLVLSVNRVLKEYGCLLYTSPSPRDCS